MKKRWHIWGITMLSTVFTAFVLVWIFMIGFNSDQPGSFFNKGNNAVWIAHEWVGTDKSDQDIQKLVETLKANQIGTVFVHSGPFKEDGSIDPETYKYSINFLEKARKFDDKIKYQAWLGQLRKKIDLSDENVRHNIAKQSMILTTMVGFDGIHFDIEPVWDGDEHFIKTLEESRETMLPDKKISVALSEFVPKSFIWLTQKLHKFENYNTEVNYKNVAKYADQIVVMVYDTKFKSVEHYMWFVKEEVIRVTSLFDDKDVFIAIPAYEKGNAEFDPKVENVESGLRGIISGLNNSRSSEENFAGVAIYPHWEMNTEKWEIYKNLWLQ